MNEFTPQPADQTPQGEQPQDEPPASDSQASDAQASDAQASDAQAYPRHGYQHEYDQRPSGYEPLFRPAQGRMIAGVAAGIAEYLGVDVTIVRIALAVLTAIGGAGIPIYVAGWLLIPDEESDQSIASEFISSLQSRAN
jgi:phage shock protein C